MAVMQSDNLVRETQPAAGSLTAIYAIAMVSLVLFFAAVCIRKFFPFPEPTDTAIFLYRQDTLLLLVGSGLLIVASIRLGQRARPLDLPDWALPVLALALVAICYAGCKWLLYGLELSRDEQMAAFDAQIFASGRLVQPLPSMWQTHADALDTYFMLPALRPVAWISGYLPMNAMLRAAVGLLGDPALTGPLMVGLGAIALWNCARILWPQDREAAVVALLLYVCSGQVLFNGMTAYAMPAHLTLDLVWLWLFLLDRRGTDLLALLVGFVATGLHQPLFHPLFAAPILFMLLIDRNWSRAALYAMGYAAICAFWIAWPGWMHALVLGPAALANTGAVSFFARISLILSGSDPARWQEMAANLLRFIAWQHLLLLPLMAAGIVLARRERWVGAFATSVLLPICITALILPWQGHGFGYRYLHGVMGVAILLAVYGWKSLASLHGSLRPYLLRTTLAGLVVVIPLQALMANEFYGLYAKLDRRIEASGADYFITGSRDAPFSQDLVINRPDLSNHPLRLVGDKVDEAVVRIICRSGGRVLLPTSELYRPIEHYFFLAPQTKADARIAYLSPRLKAAGCTVGYLD